MLRLVSERPFWLAAALVALPLALGVVWSCSTDVLVGSNRVSGSSGAAGTGGTITRAPCASEGDACSGPLDCCSRACIAGACQAACVPDSSPCTTSEQCCSGGCAKGRCEPLNTRCSTAGNPCDDSSECCSSLCFEGICELKPSYCTQPGDTCKFDDECCTGTCQRSLGAPLGICADAPKGPSNCGDGVAGTVCDDCNRCCSRLCAPFDVTGVMICQPASGCRMTGELCRVDSDCCGSDAAEDLPGAGSVTCVREPTATFGVCRNPTGCRPQGASCHFADYACSISASANSCCGDPGAGEACALDEQGIPRCNAVFTCRIQGETCGASSDCCVGECVQDELGSFRCEERE